MKLVLTAFQKRTDAFGFAKKLLKAKLAGCCTALPGAVSLYEWKGRQVKAAETLLLIKTTASKLNRLKAFFENDHPYELPEFLCWDADATKEFGIWMEKNVK
jgi:periplasmic divalent cation tolerance protein